MTVEYPISKSQLEIILQAKGQLDLAIDKLNGLLTMAVVAKYDNAKVVQINAENSTIMLEIPDETTNDSDTPGKVERELKLEASTT